MLMGQDTTQYHVLERKIDHLSDSSFYEKAITVCDSIIPILASKPSFFEQKFYSIFLGQKARNLGLLKRYSESLNFYEKALIIRNNISKKSNIKSVEFITSKANIWGYLNQPDSAIKYYERALSHLKELTEIDGYANAWIAALQGKSSALMKKGKINTADSLLHEILSFSEKLDQNDPKIIYRLIFLHRSLWRLYINTYRPKQAIPHAKKALKFSQKRYMPTHPIVAEGYNRLAKSFIYTGYGDSALQYYDSALTCNHSPQSLYRLYNNKGIVLGAMGHTNRGLAFQLKAFELCLKEFPDNYQSLGIYSGGISASYGQLKEHKLAKLYGLKSLDYYENLFGPEHNQVIEAKRQLGHILTELGEYELAMSYFKEILKINSKQADNSNRFYSVERGRILHGIANHYFLKMQFDSALMVLSEARSLFEEFLEPSSPLMISSYNFEGVVYKERKEYEKAIQALNQITGFNEEYWVNNQSEAERVVNYYLSLGEVFFLNKDFQQSIAALEKGIRYVQINSSHKGEFDSSIPNYVLLLHFLSKNHFFRFCKENNPIHLDEAVKIVQQSLTLLSGIRKSQVSQESKINLNTYLNDVFQLASEIYYQAWASNRLPLEELFHISEQQKSTVLLEHIDNQKIIDNLFDSPDSINQLLNLEIQQTQLEQRISNERKKQADLQNETLIKEWTNQLFELENKETEFLQHLETHYPDYYNLKYKEKSISIKEIQQALLPNQGMLEYLLGDTSLFVFVITSDTFLVKKIFRDSLLEANLKSFNESLYRCPSALEIEGCDEQENKKNRSILGFQLYQQLILPVEEYLPDRLIIIPDGVLGYLPFEALHTEASKEGQKVNSAYWLNDKSISYAFSATLWLEMKQRKHRKQANRSLLAFAPSFDQGDSLVPFRTRSAYRKSYFGPLLHTRSETNGILALIKGDLFADTSATLTNFHELASKYQILHLATHGKVMEDPRYSLLAFYGPQDSIFLADTIQYGISALYLADLYTLQLNADLVVLSACETGVGKLYQGEGIASLARGFTYAGAKSLVPSLWSVDDQSTAYLMKRFYYYLSEHLDKDIALQQAKMDLIKEGQDNPYYWAAFVLMGDVAPLNQSSNNWMWWILAGLIGSVIGLYLFRRRHSSS